MKGSQNNKHLLREREVESQQKGHPYSVGEKIYVNKGLKSASNVYSGHRELKKEVKCMGALQ